VQGLQRMSSD